jgi:hypothetical protein
MMTLLKIIRLIKIKNHQQNLGTIAKASQGKMDPQGREGTVQKKEEGMIKIRKRFWIWISQRIAICRN